MQLSFFTDEVAAPIREERANAVLQCRLVGNRMGVFPISECDYPARRCAFPHRLRVIGEEYTVARLIAMRAHYRAIGPIVPMGRASAAQIAQSEALRAALSLKKDEPSWKRARLPEGNDKSPVEREDPTTGPTKDKDEGPHGHQQLWLVRA